MKKVLSVFVLATLLFAFASCEKDRAAAEACFDIGDAELKSGKTIRFMNCSKNYDYTQWIVADSAMVPIFIAPTDTLLHFNYNFPPGKFNVILHVVQGDSVSLAQQTTEYTFLP